MQSTVYREERRDLTVGERIQVTAPDKELGLRAREFGTVEKIAENNALPVRMDSGKTVELDRARSRHIEYGYVVDGWKAVSADRVLVTLENAQQLTREGPIYAAISRASHDATM